MKTAELKAWIESAKYIQGKKDYDQSGNDTVESIYEKDGQFFKVWLFNGSPCRKWDKATRKYLADEVEDPIPVKPVKTEVIEYL